MREHNKTIQRYFFVKLERARTGSFITLAVHAVNPALAGRWALNELPGWKLVNFVEMVNR